MPLELGIFIGAKAFGGKHHRRKAAVVFDTDRFRYQKYISDIAGQDIRAHGQQPSQAIHQTRDFLSTHCEDGVILPGGEKIVERYSRFQHGLVETCAAVHLLPEKLTFRDLTNFIVGWLRTNPLTTLAAG